MTNDIIRPRKAARTPEEFVDSASADHIDEAYSKLGRPFKRGEPTRNKAFNLPLSMIDRLMAEAEEITGGNASALALRIFSAYFNGKDKG